MIHTHTHTHTNTHTHTQYKVRLHVRDRDTAVNDVETLMSGYKRKRLTAMMTGAAAAPPAAGVLLFSCLGRGRALFNEANFDSRMAHISTGVPVAGVCVCVYEGGRGGTCIY